MMVPVDGDFVVLLGHRRSFIFCYGDRCVKKIAFAQLGEGPLGLGLSSSCHFLSIVALVGVGIKRRVRVRVRVDRCHFGVWLNVWGRRCRELGQCSIRLADLDARERFYLS